MDELNNNIQAEKLKHIEAKANGINQFMCWYLIIGLFFGVLFYDFIDKRIGFSYIDEILAFSLCLFTLFAIIHDPSRKFESHWLWLFGIFTFYIIYSITIHSNTKSAIIQDAIVEIKPFLGFFCAYSLGAELTFRQKRFIQASCFIAVFCLLLTTYDIYYFMGHPSRYATAATFIAFLFLFVSDLTKKNIIRFLLLLFISILSGRSKAFGFVTFASILVLYYYYSIKFTFTFKNLLLFFLLIGLVLLVSWNKIDYYFIYGSESIMSNETGNAFARPAMYWGAWQILCDIPFGSGFASFGTYFSSIYYADTYYVYGLNMVHGLSEKMPDFMADAYYPSLAQYGFAGVVVFIYFWVYVLRNVYRFRIIDDLESNKYAFLVVGIVVFFAIELVADTTLTHNRGFFMMVLMGLSLSFFKKRIAAV